MPLDELLRPELLRLPHDGSLPSLRHPLDPGVPVPKEQRGSYRRTLVQFHIRSGARSCGVELLRQLHRALHVGEEDGDLLALALAVAFAWRIFSASGVWA